MSDTITDTTVLDMIEEGKNNFVSSRFDDAAKLFNSTVRNLESRSHDIDAIYFRYARIVALDKADKKEQQIQALIELSQQSQRLALKQAIQQQKLEKSPLEKSRYMNYAQKLMKIRGEEEERESVVLSLIQLYRSLLQDENTTMDLQILFMERIIEFCKESDHPSLDEKTESLDFATLLQSLGDELGNSQRLAVDVQAANHYIRAAEIYRKYSREKDMKDLLEKALRCSKYGQFDKYGFIRVDRPPRAKDEMGNEIEPDPDTTDKMIRKYLQLFLDDLQQDHLKNKGE